MERRFLVAGVDIGSGQVCCAIGSCDCDSRKSEILGVAKVACEEIESGSIDTIPRSADTIKMALKTALESAEKKSDVQGVVIQSVIVAVRGSKIQFHNLHGKSINNNSELEIGEDHIKTALEDAEYKIKIEQNHDILQKIPSRYIIDGQRKKYPVGLFGRDIEVSLSAVTIPNSDNRNMQKAMQQAMQQASFLYSDNKYVYGYWSVSDVILTKEEKDLSCLLVDIGGSTIGLVNYVDGTIKNSDEIPDGSDKISRDIQKYFKISAETARKIKEEHGAAFVSSDLKDAEFSFVAANGKTFKRTRFELIDNVIRPKVDIILQEIANVIETKKYGDSFLTGGIVLTGGGSKLNSIVEAFEAAFKCSVRLGYLSASPTLDAPHDVMADMSYTTAIGAVAGYFCDNSISDCRYVPNSGRLAASDIIASFFKKIKELF
ncbi:MAG: cell division protein FtsA [Elusimicrobiota bacterium]|jgi:cell division protein FtsA|nr:cell division protein FtsA [Elusimicrobiota bacterium]